MSILLLFLRCFLRSSLVCSLAVNARLSCLCALVRASGPRPWMTLLLAASASPGCMALSLPVTPGSGLRFEVLQNRPKPRVTVSSPFGSICPHRPLFPRQHRRPPLSAAGSSFPRPWPPDSAPPACVSGWRVELPRSLLFSLSPHCSSASSCLLLSSFPLRRPPSAA